MKKTNFKLLTLFFLIAFSINSWAQKTQVSGIVTDQSKLSVPGVNVIGAKNVPEVQVAGCGIGLISPDKEMLEFSMLQFP